MSFFHQELYISLESELLECGEQGKNILIVTFPGSGITYFLKKFIERHGSSGINYTDDLESNLKKFNIINYSFNKNEDALDKVDSYYRQASLKEKFAVVINTPHLLTQQKYKKSFVAGHMYSSLFFGLRSKKDTIIFAKEVNKDLQENELEKIYDLTHGAGQLVKYFALNKDIIGVSYQELLKRKTFQEVFDSMVHELKKCDEELLTELGFMQKGEFQGTIFRTFFENRTLVHRKDIVIHKDLLFEECGLVSKDRLTKQEKDILEVLIDEDVITREQIADIKWGEGSYDEYSDQAINKTMQRLGAKLTKHALFPIPTLGYKIEIK